MKEVVDKFARVFGASVILVSLCSGCASQGTPSATPMSYNDLNYFKVDCRIAAQQRAMLESMRRTRDEAALDQIFGQGNINKQINMNLFELRYCP
jgi:hypothetical protein